MSVALAVSACGLSTPGEDGGPDVRKSFILPDRPPPAASLRAGGPGGAIDAAAEAAERFASALARDPAARRREPGAAPLLFASPEGRAYREARGPRAFALGDPAARCPARSWAPGPDAEAAARAALRGCFEQLRRAGAGAADCGCRVIAADAALLGAPEDFAYAPGVSARLISPALELDLDATAREAPAPGGGRRLLLRPVPGPDPAELTLRPDGSATLRMDGELWRGRRIAEGLTRGRFRERVHLERADGARLTVAAGWPPVAFALARRELLRWPGE